jgi:hypothetical protein
VLQSPHAELTNTCSCIIKQLKPLTPWPFDIFSSYNCMLSVPCSDSMSKDLYKAIKCFMFEFQDLTTYHASNNYTAMYLLDSIPGFGEPHCVHMPQRTRLCQVRYAGCMSSNGAGCWR